MLDAMARQAGLLGRGEQGYKYLADRAADGWVGSGCLGGKCAKWY